MCEFLQNIKNIHSILKGITTKKRKGRGGEKKKKKRHRTRKNTRNTVCIPTTGFLYMLVFQI